MDAESIRFPKGYNSLELLGASPEWRAFVELKKDLQEGQRWLHHLLLSYKDGVPETLLSESKVQPEDIENFNVYLAQHLPGVSVERIEDSDGVRYCLRKTNLPSRG